MIGCALVLGFPASRLADPRARPELHPFLEGTKWSGVVGFLRRQAAVGSANMKLQNPRARRLISRIHLLTATPRQCRMRLTGDGVAVNKWIRDINLLA